MSGEMAQLPRRRHLGRRRPFADELTGFVSCTFGDVGNRYVSVSPALPNPIAQTLALSENARHWKRKLAAPDPEPLILRDRKIKVAVSIYDLLPQHRLIRFVRAERAVYWIMSSAADARW